MPSCNSAINPLSGKETPKLFPIFQNGKVGYINRKGEVVIQPQFAPQFTIQAGYFSEGLAVACVDGNKCGYIDETGKFVINPQFDETLPFSDEGLADVFLNQKLGFIDKDGKYIVNPQFGNGGYSNLEMLFMITSDLGRLSFSDVNPPKNHLRFSWVSLVFHHRLENSRKYYVIKTRNIDILGSLIERS